MKLKISLKQHLVLTAMLVAVVSLGCGYIDPIREKIAGNDNGTGAQPTEVAAVTRPTKTPRPTFTPTPDWTPTPTVTLTPTESPTPSPSPIPTETLTPVPTNTPPPTNTPAPTNTVPPTNTPKPKPPTATFTPAPPTATPTPNFPFKIAEGPIAFPTTNSWLIMFIALVDSNNVPIGNMKVIGDHQPSGLHWESAPSCFSYCEANGYSGTVKQGNVKFDPPRYESGVWNIYVVDGGGQKVSDVIPITVDAATPGWWFMIFKNF